MKKRNKRLFAPVLILCTVLGGMETVNADWLIFKTTKYLKSFIKSDRSFEEPLIRAIENGLNYNDLKMRKLFDQCYAESAYVSDFSNAYSICKGDPVSIIRYAVRSNAQKGLLAKLSVAYKTRVGNYCRSYNKRTEIDVVSPSKNADLKKLLAQVDKDMRRPEPTMDKDIQKFCGLKMKYLLSNGDLVYTQGMIPILTSLIELMYIDPTDPQPDWKELCLKLNLWSKKVDDGFNNEIEMVTGMFSSSGLQKIMEKLIELFPEGHETQKESVQLVLGNCSDDPAVLASTIIQRGVLDWTSIPALRAIGSKLFYSIKSKEDVDKFYKNMFNELVKLSIK